MSRYFNGSDQYLNGSLAGLNGVPLTISCWFKSAGDGSAVTPLVSLYKSGSDYSSAGSSAFIVGFTHASTSFGVPVSLISYANSGTTLANTPFTGYIAGNDTWTQCGVIFTSRSNRALYCNGVVSSNSTTIDLQNVNNVCLGKYSSSSSGPFATPSGLSIGEVGIWSEALTSQEMQSLGSGISPYLIRPSALVAYYPLLTDSLNEFDAFGIILANSGNVSIGNSHPPVIKGHSAKVKFPDTHSSNNVNLYLHGALRYGSGVLPGGFSAGFGSGFSGGYGPDDLLGAPPGWHMNLFAYNAGSAGGYAQASGITNLYACGHYHIDNITPSFNEGFSFGYERQNYFPLFAKSTPEGNPSGLMNLFVQAPRAVSASGGINLYTWATTNSGIRSNFDLFVHCERTGTQSGSMNLFVLENQGLDASTSMNLFVQGPDNRVYGSVDLFVQNSWQSATSGIDLFLQAPSGTEGAVPFSGTMNLYLSRGNDRWAGSCDLYVHGVRTLYSGVNMFAHAQPNANSGIPLYTQGMVPSLGTIELYTSGY